MRHRLLTSSLAVLLLSAAAFTLQGCTKSRAAALRDRSAVIEKKLITERDRALADSAAAERESRMTHLQNLRLGLSVINVSIVTVPLVLATENEQAIGYSVLDEAIGTIDWNIPLYDSSSGSTLRPYPALFSPQTGLDYDSIRRGNAPAGIAR